MLPENDWSADLKKAITDLEEYFQPLIKEWAQEPPPEYVYHYSSVHTVRSILKSQKIRLYDLKSMKEKKTKDERRRKGLPGTSSRLRDRERVHG